jgi:mannose-6-phosphate isomerase-like protein (cupin superfamily)
MMRYRFVPPGGGQDYDWARDHTFVKVATADTGGAFALMEDNLKRELSLGLHLHRQHAETFYILDGRVDFHIDGDWMTTQDFADAGRMDELAVKYDIINLGDVPARA